jgi:hypothetical protein
MGLGLTTESFEKESYIELTIILSVRVVKTNTHNQTARGLSSTVGPNPREEQNTANV